MQTYYKRFGYRDHSDTHRIVERFAAPAVLIAPVAPTIVVAPALVAVLVVLGLVAVLAVFE